jgi:hypothetical protein
LRLDFIFIAKIPATKSLLQRQQNTAEYPEYQKTASTSLWLEYGTWVKKAGKG